MTNTISRFKNVNERLGSSKDVNHFNYQRVSIKLTWHFLRISFSNGSMVEGPRMQPSDAPTDLSGITRTVCVFKAALCLIIANMQKTNTIGLGKIITFRATI